MDNTFSDAQISGLLLQQESLDALFLKIMDAKVAAETAQYIYEAAVQEAGGHLSPNQLTVLKLFLDKEFKKSISAEFGDYQINKPVSSSTNSVQKVCVIDIQFPSVGMCLWIGRSVINIDPVHGVDIDIHYLDGEFLARPEEYLTQYMRTVKSLANP